VSRRVPVLGYHALIADDQKELPPQWSPFHALSLSAFCAQVDMLTAERWRVIAPPALTCASLPRKSIVITFDDGHSSDRLAARELQRRGMTAAFFVTWSRLGTDWFLSRSQVLELDCQGFTIGSHGMTHTPMAQLSERELRDQLVSSREHLENLLGKPVTALALPYGSYNDNVADAAIGAGYRLIMTSDFSLAVPGSFLFPRLMIGSRSTMREFRSLLTENRITIGRLRLLNGIRRRLQRLHSNGGRH
jgi:peptidoglycan/xylan/chitin deacetylase (PgdA/CDA1 family)